MAVGGIPRFERFFREAAGLRVDKDDLKRFDSFVQLKVADLLLMGEVTAKANNRDVIMLHDLPIAKGLEERMAEFRRLDVDMEINEMLIELAAVPQLESALSEELSAHLSEVAGGLSVAIARVLRILDPRARHPSTALWERANELFDVFV